MSLSFGHFGGTSGETSDDRLCILSAYTLSILLLIRTVLASDIRCKSTLRPVYFQFCGILDSWNVARLKTGRKEENEEVGRHDDEW